MIELARHAGPVFDVICGHVDKPPSTPIAEHTDAFVEWTAAHLVHPLNTYTAYPEVTAKEIKALAAAADVSAAGQQRPFLVILPIKSRLAFAEVKLLLLARGRGTTKDLDSVGTPHFAQSPRILDKSSILYSNSPKTHHPLRAENTSRSSLTLLRRRTAIPSDSTRRILA
jgi:hypothetical protein